MPPGVGSVRKPVQAQRQRARSGLEHPELEIVRSHRGGPYRNRGSYGATLPPSAQARTGSDTSALWRRMSASAERVCDGLNAGGRGCWLLWTGAPAVTATVRLPFQLCTAEQREGPGRCCSPSTSMANGSPSAGLESAAPPTAG